MSPSSRRKTDRRKTAQPISNDRRRAPRRHVSERRTSVRVPIDMWMEEVRGEEVYFRRSCDLSEGGVFFEQSIPHNVGTPVSLRFSLPGTEISVQVNAQVTSASRAKDSLGMGLKFIDISKTLQATLRHYIGAVLAAQSAGKNS